MVFRYLIVALTMLASTYCQVHFADSLLISFLASVTLGVGGTLVAMYCQHDAR